MNIILHRIAKKPDYKMDGIMYDNVMKQVKQKKDDYDKQHPEWTKIKNKSDDEIADLFVNECKDDLYALNLTAITAKSFFKKYDIKPFDSPADGQDLLDIAISGNNYKPLLQQIKICFRNLFEKSFIKPKEPVWQEYVDHYGLAKAEQLYNKIFDKWINSNEVNAYIGEQMYQAWSQEQDEEKVASLPHDYLIKDISAMTNDELIDTITSLSVFRNIVYSNIERDSVMLVDISDEFVEDVLVDSIDALIDYSTESEDISADEAKKILNRAYDVIPLMKNNSQFKKLVYDYLKK